MITLVRFKYEINNFKNPVFGLGFLTFYSLIIYNLSNEISLPTEGMVKNISSFLLHFITFYGILVLLGTLLKQTV